MTPLVKLLIAIGCLAVIWAYSGPARSHSWYPIECCHQLDCAPASITKIEGNDYLVTTKHGQVRGPIDFSKVRPSPDAEPHACINKDRDGRERVLCLWLPTGV